MLINVSRADNETFEREFREKLNEAIAAHLTLPPPTA